MSKILFTLLLGIVLHFSAFSQAYIQNTMYHFNRLAYNPAFAGHNGDLSLTLMGRLQWAGIDGAPRLVTASLDKDIANFGGLGGYVIRDELGPLITTGVNLSYSFHWELGDNGSALNIGVQGGYLQKQLNAVWKIKPGVFDPIVGENGTNFRASTGVPSLGAGLFYQHVDANGEDRFYVGLSGLDLLEPSIDQLTLSPGLGTDSRVPRSFYLMGGYKFDIGLDAALEPTVLARTDGSSFQFDVSLFAHYKVMVFGVNYRFQDSFAGILGFDLSDRTFIGYSYDYTTSGLGINGDGSSHEIIFSFKFQGADRNRPAEETPIRNNRID